MLVSPTHICKPNKLPPQPEDLAQVGGAAREGKPIMFAYVPLAQPAWVRRPVPEKSGNDFGIPMRVFCHGPAEHREEVRR